MSEWVSRWIAPEDEESLDRARAFVERRSLDRAPLGASLEQKAVREHSRMREVLQRGEVVALAARLDGVFPWTSVVVDAAMPGAAARALDGIERPFTALSGEALWSEMQRAGGDQRFEEIQMARLRHGGLPGPDSRVVELADREEVESARGVGVSETHFRAGPWCGIRDEAGELISWGGVQYVTGRAAQLGYIGTRDASRRSGLATAVVAELVRLLESPGRTVLLHVGVDNHAAIRLYSALGFRGRRRVAMQVFSG